MAEPISIQQLKDASEDAISLADFINKPENVMIPRRLASDINSLQYYLDYMSSYAQHSYETYDEMVANTSNLSENISVFVTNDSDTSKNGIYTYNGTSFVKGDYQPENAAREFVETKLGGLEVFDGKVRAQDVSTEDGNTQDVKNTEFRNELDALPFEGGVLADTFVTVTANGVGTVARTQQEKNSDSLSVKDFGIVGDGSDEWQALRDAFAFVKEGVILDFNGLVVSTSKGVKITNKSGFSLKNGGIKISDSTPINSDDQPLFLRGCTKFSVEDFVIDANRQTRGIREVAAHNLQLAACKDFTVSNVQLLNAVCDGLYILSESAAMVNNVTSHGVFNNVLVSNAARNNCAIITGKHLTFNNCEFNGANGMLPMAGVDIESNKYGVDNLSEFITFNGCEFADNKGHQLMITSHDKPKDIIVDNCVFRPCLEPDMTITPTNRGGLSISGSGVRVHRSFFYWSTEIPVNDIGYAIKAASRVEGINPVIDGCYVESGTLNFTETDSVTLTNNTIKSSYVSLINNKRSYIENNTFDMSGIGISGDKLDDTIVQSHIDCNVFGFSGEASSLGRYILIENNRVTSIRHNTFNDIEKVSLYGVQAKSNIIFNYNYSVSTAPVSKSILRCDVRDATQIIGNTLDNKSTGTLEIARNTTESINISNFKATIRDNRARISGYSTSSVSPLGIPVRKTNDLLGFSGDVGVIVFDSDTKEVKVWSGIEWIALGNKEPEPEPPLE